jgi:hypothetical protein
MCTRGSWRCRNAHCKARGINNAAQDGSAKDAFRWMQFGSRTILPESGGAQTLPKAINDSGVFVSQAEVPSCSLDHIGVKRRN